MGYSLSGDIGVYRAGHSAARSRLTIRSVLADPLLLGAIAASVGVIVAIVLGHTGIFLAAIVLPVLLVSMRFPVASGGLAGLIAAPIWWWAATRGLETGGGQAAIVIPTALLVTVTAGWFLQARLLRSISGAGLLDVMRTVVSQRYAQGVIDALVTQLPALVRAEFISIWALRDGEITLLAGAPRDPVIRLRDQLTADSVPWSLSSLAAMPDLMEGLVTAGASVDLSSSAARMADRAGLHSWLVAPLGADGEIWGAVAAANGRRRRFRSRDVEVMNSVATLVAPALRQARALELEDRLDDRARAISRQQREMVTVLAQELRQPAATLMLATETLGSPGVVDAQLRQRLVANAMTAGRRMMYQLDVLDDAARLDAGEMRLRPEPLDTAAIVEEIVELRLGERGQLSHTSTSTWRLDGHAFHRIVEAFIGAAREFSEPESVIDVDLDTDARLLYLRVRFEVDPSRPLPVDAAQLFARNTTTPLSVAKLGLDVAASLAAAHDGETRADMYSNTLSLVATMPQLSSDSLATSD